MALKQRCMLTEEELKKRMGIREKKEIDESDERGVQKELKRMATSTGHTRSRMGGIQVRGWGNRNGGR